MIKLQRIVKGVILMEELIFYNINDALNLLKVAIRDGYLKTFIIGNQYSKKDFDKLIEERSNRIN